MGDLGINGNVNQNFNEAARIEIGSDKLDNRFEWNQEEVQSHILIGLKSGSLLCHQLTEQEMVEIRHSSVQPGITCVAFPLKPEVNNNWTGGGES